MPSSSSPTPTRQKDNVATPVANAVSAQIKTISIEELLRTTNNISVLKNGWPNWGLRNRDMKILEDFSERDAPFISIILSMLMPYVSLTVLKESDDISNDGESQEQQSSAEDSFVNESSDDENINLDSILFSNDDLMESISHPIGLDELHFLSFGKNKVSIRSVKIDVEETTGLYSVKRFKFSFVIHRPSEFSENGVMRSIFDPSKKFMFKWGYNIDLDNETILPSATRIASIIGAQNKETIMFNKWDVKQEDNDQNIEVEAEAIPVSSKSFVTVKMGEHVLSENPEDSSVLESYQDSLEAIENINQGNTNNTQAQRSQEKIRNNIQSEINKLLVDSFATSMSNITKNTQNILFSDILDEVSKCMKYSLKKNNQNNGVFKFVCGKFNSSIGASDDYIGNFSIDTNSFTNVLVARIKKDKNIPHPLEFLDSVINEYLVDYSSYRNVSSTINKLLARKETQENTIKSQSTTSRNRDALDNASQELQKINDELKKIMIPAVKFFTHEHRNERNEIMFYCFIIDSSFGIPSIYDDNTGKTAFERVIESNKASGVLIEDNNITETDLAFLNNDVNPESASSITSFDIPVVDLFSENTIFKSQTLGSTTDDELQSSLIKRMTDAAKNEQGDDQIESISFNDQFKFLTTNISAKMLGNNAVQIYQPIFWRLFLRGSIFERLYTVTKLSHTIDQGSWETELECVMTCV